MRQRRRKKSREAKSHHLTSYFESYFRITIKKRRKHDERKRSRENESNRDGNDEMQSILNDNRS